MAYQDNELFSSASRDSSLRVFPKSIAPKTLAAAAGGPTLPALTPLAFNTSTNKWVVWTNGGSNGTGTISGFLWPDAVTLDATDDTLAQVLMAGDVHYEDIPVPSGETLANLKTALRSGPRALGLMIKGLDNVR